MSPRASLALRILFVLVLAIRFGGARLSAEDLELKGQAAIWFSLSTGRPSTPRFGLRYIPELSLWSEDGMGHRLDAVFAANAFLTGSAAGWKHLDTDGRVRAYRVWIRLSSAQFELRAGLQKINFGSAAIFRPLMWFDRIDARDPLQITAGVTGLLLRYYFENNANIWVWGLVGNSDPKGWEASPTKKGSAELGARLQVPLLAGEFALSYHRRKADLSEHPEIPLPGESLFVPENRFGIDGKWDVGIGVWFEGALVHQAAGFVSLPYQRSFTVGADYTFGIGNGLHVLAEHFALTNASRILGGGPGLDFSAFSLSYPVGLLDSLSAFVYYDWENSQMFRFLSWRRTYDRWQLFLMGFWNPDDSPFFQTQQGNNLFGGAGFQVMLVFNH